MDKKVIEAGVGSVGVHDWNEKPRQHQIWAGAEGDGRFEVVRLMSANGAELVLCASFYGDALACAPLIRDFTDQLGEPSNVRALGEEPVTVLSWIEQP